MWGFTSFFTPDAVKQFNDRTSRYIPDIPTPVKLTAFSDRTFEFEVRTPPTSFLLKKAAGITAGSSRPGGEQVGTVTRRACYEIAKIKSKDLSVQYVPLEGIFKSVIGTAGSCGIKVEGD